jgi:hypothetical protein
VIKAPSSSRGIKRSQRIITKVVVNNNIFIFGTSDGVILRWNIESGGESEEIEIAKKPEVTHSLCPYLLLTVGQDIFHNLFIDSTGHHVIIGLNNGEGYYLHSRSTKPKKLSKLHGVIESVAFDRIRVETLLHIFRHSHSLHSQATETNTKSFLIGTSTGPSPPLPSLITSFVSLSVSVIREDV